MKIGFDALAGFNEKLPHGRALLTIFSLLTAITVAAQTGGSPGERLKPISMDQLGAVASQQYHGEALGITPTADGALLRCAFQKLEGHVTADGLWLESTEPGGGKLRVLATAVGRAPDFGVRRQSAAATPFWESDWLASVFDTESGVALCLPPQSKMLPVRGVVSVNYNLVRFTRPGLTEEYSVSVDGLRQDFVISERPGGDGELQVELELIGARAEALANGVKLTMNGSGRTLVYNRLHVTDAIGRELVARLEVSSGILPAATTLSIIVSDADAIYPIRIDPTISDSDWVSFNSGINGADGAVFALAIDDQGNLYAGGGFHRIGSVEANRIAKWDGTTWSALGSGVEGNDTGNDYLAGVSAVLVDGTDVYVGGSFTHAGGQRVNRIARWDGTSWSALGSGVTAPWINPSVGALAKVGNYIYAGGSFTAAGGVSANYVAKWDGTRWSALGAGVAGDEGVFSLVADGKNLYVGGAFTSAGGVPANNIAKWNGTAWSALGAGVDSAVSALVMSGNDLYVGGYFTLAGGIVANGVAKWDGSTWSNLGDGIIDRYVLSLAVSGSILYAGGMFTSAGGVPANNIAKWDGTAWSSVGDGVDQEVRSLAIAGTNLYVGGYFTQCGNLPANFIARWNGTTYSSLGNGIGGTGRSGFGPWVSAITMLGGELFIGGNFTSVNCVTAKFIAKWNGNAWAALGSGLNGGVNALGVFNTDLIVGVQGWMPPTDVDIRWVGKWDGMGWSNLGFPDLGRVNAIAVVGDDIYVGGGYGVSKLSGTNWTNLERISDCFALATSGTNLYAGASYPANCIYQWDGSAWRLLGSADKGNVFALVTSGTDVYVGGDFASIDGVNVNSIAKWNGYSWSSLGTGLNGTVYALAVVGSSLYAGGDFTTADGLPANHIAKWDGETWSPLGSGVDGRVRAIYYDTAGHLFVGGEFLNAGGKPSACIAQYNIEPQPICIDRICLDGGMITLDCRGAPACAHQIQRASDILFTQNVTTLCTTNVPPGGRFQFVDPEPPGTAAFYRLMKP